MGIQNLAGQTLGQYELRELLGAGGMGAVYRGYQANLRRYVAVKILSNELADQPGYLERFNREAQTSAALEHPHIITVHDYGMQQGISYLVMQLLSGGSLTERLRQRAESANPLPSLGEVADLLKQVGSALDYAHSEGVIHRDIKPSNVMFDNHGNAYLVDFGIAKLVQATQVLTASGTVIGTWPYMAPEQWRNEDLLPATDQYALGVMIYQLVSGQLPFEAPTPAGVMYKHLNEMPTPPHAHRPGLPEALTLVIERALAKRPQDRFVSCTAFAQAFAGAIESSTGPNTHFFVGSLKRKAAPATMAASEVYVTPGSGAQAAGRPIHRHPLMWVMAALLVTTIAVIAFLLLGTGDDGGKETPPTATQVAAVVEDSPTAISALTSTTETPLPADTPTVDVTAMVQATVDAGMTQTATQWTSTPQIPTVDYVGTIDAQMTALYVQDLTGTASQWTPIPSATLAPTVTPTETQTTERTPTAVPTATSTATASATWTLTWTPTVSLTLTQDAIQAALVDQATRQAQPTEVSTDMFAGVSIEQAVDLARTFSGSNDDWTPVIQEFDGVEMVLVPAGCFMMGSEGGGDNERPVHEVCFEEPFWIDKYEVTNRQYGSVGCTASSSDPEQPRNCVSWFSARDHCEAREAYLPTEAQWEYAARGPDVVVYPWGDGFVADNVVYVGNSIGTAGVGSKPAGVSWVGALDMSGNVWEWSHSLYKDYPYDISDGRESDTDDGTDVRRVLRGGSFTLTSSFLVATFRNSERPFRGGDTIGFRCARSIDQAASFLEPTPDPLDLALNFSGGNNDWAPLIQEFDGVEMVLVPAGCFMMGSEELGDDEQPEHKVCFEEPFWIDRFEVSNGQYNDFGGFSVYQSQSINRKHPRENLSWTEARLFCARERNARLPTEAEWEYAARGPDNWVYPWGDTFEEDRAVWKEYFGPYTETVGSLPGGESWVGALDMSGNVWEWVSDRYTENYYSTLSEGVVNPQGPEDGEDRVIRGGSANSESQNALQTAFRLYSATMARSAYIGFRCAHDFGGDTTGLLSDESETDLTTTPAVIVLYEEDFEDERAEGWFGLSSPQYGTWRVFKEEDGNNVFLGTAEPDQCAVAYIGSSSWSDYSIDLKFKYYNAEAYSDAASFHVLFRAQDFDNYYSFASYPEFGSFDIRLKRGGQFRVFPDMRMSVDKDAWHDVSIEVKSDQIRASFDGRPFSDIYDDTFETGWAGLIVCAHYSGTKLGVLFDDVRIIATSP